MLIKTKNACIADGRVSKINFRITDKGVPMLKFYLAYDKDPENIKHNMFLNCTCFYEKAERWKHLQESMEVLVSGKYDLRPYKDKEGKEKNSEECIVSFIANSLQFAVAEEPTINEKENDDSDDNPF